MDSFLFNLPPLHFSCHSLVLTSLFTQANFVFPLLRQESGDCAKISSQVSNSNSNLQLISRALPLPAAAASFPHSFSTQFPIACCSLYFPLSISGRCYCVVVVGYSGLLIRGFGELADSFEGLFGSVCCLFAFEMDTE